MKKSICMCIVLAVAMLLASCSGEKQYVNVLPEEPGAVVSIDLKQLVQKSDLSAEDTKTVVDEVKNALSGELDAQGAALMDKVLANPDESGLDFRSKIYLFADSKLEKGGLLACVGDKDKLGALTDLLGKQPAEDKGAYRQAVMEEGVLAYSEKSCLLLFSDKGDKADLQGWASELMGQETKGAFSKSKAFESMEKIKGDISVYASMNLLPDVYKVIGKASMPMAVDWKDINVVAGMRFEKGRMVLDTETLMTEELKKEYEKINSIYSDETSDKFLELFPQSAFMWMSMGVKGEKLYEVLEKEPSLDAQLQSVQTVFDLKSLLGAVEGETVMCVSSLNPVSFALLAEVKNADFMQSFESLKPMLDMTGGQMKLVEDGENAYELQMADGRMLGMPAGSAASVYLGVKDNVFYLTNDRQCAEGKEADRPMKEAVWAGNVPGKRVFLAMNWGALSEVMNGDNHRIYGSKDRLMQIVLNQMDYFTVEAEDDTHGRIELGMKDKETNVLKQWINMGKQLAAQ